MNNVNSQKDPNLEQHLNMNMIEVDNNDIEDYNSDNRSCTCYYCGKNAADFNTNYAKELYKVLGRSGYTYWNGWHRKEVSYKTTIIYIDRCKRCKTIHSTILGISIAISLFLILGFNYLLGKWTELPSFGWVCGWFAAYPIWIITKTIVGLVISFLFGIKRAESVRKEPQVIEMRENGWTLIKPFAF